MSGNIRAAHPLMYPMEQFEKRLTDGELSVEQNPDGSLMVDGRLAYLNKKLQVVVGERPATLWQRVIHKVLTFIRRRPGIPFEQYCHQQRVLKSCKLKDRLSEKFDGCLIDNMSLQTVCLARKGCVKHAIPKSMVSECRKKNLKLAVSLNGQYLKQFENPLKMRDYLVQFSKKTLLSLPLPETSGVTLHMQFVRAFEEGLNRFVREECSWREVIDSVKKRHEQLIEQLLLTGNTSTTGNSKQCIPFTATMAKDWHQVSACLLSAVNNEAQQLCCAVTNRGNLSSVFTVSSLEPGNALVFLPCEGEFNGCGEGVVQPQHFTKCLNSSETKSLNTGITEPSSTSTTIQHALYQQTGASRFSMDGFFYQPGSDADSQFAVTRHNGEAIHVFSSEKEMNAFIESVHENQSKFDNPSSLEETRERLQKHLAYFDIRRSADPSAVWAMCSSADMLVLLEPLGEDEQLSIAQRPFSLSDSAKNGSKNSIILQQNAYSCTLSKPFKPKKHAVFRKGEESQVQVFSSQQEAQAYIESRKVDIATQIAQCASLINQTKILPAGESRDQRLSDLNDEIKQLNQMLNALGKDVAWLEDKCTLVFLQAGGEVVVTRNQEHQVIHSGVKEPQSEAAKEYTLLDNVDVDETFQQSSRAASSESIVEEEQVSQRLDLTKRMIINIDRRRKAAKLPPLQPKDLGLNSFGVEELGAKSVELADLELKDLNEQAFKHFLTQQYTAGMVLKNELLTLGYTLQDVLTYLGIDLESLPKDQFAMLSQKLTSENITSDVFAELRDEIKYGEEFEKKQLVSNWGTKWQRLETDKPTKEQEKTLYDARIDYVKKHFLRRIKKPVDKTEAPFTYQLYCEMERKGPASQMIGAQSLELLLACVKAHDGLFSERDDEKLQIPLNAVLCVLGIDPEKASNVKEYASDIYFELVMMHERGVFKNKKMLRALIKQIPGHKKYESPARLLINIEKRRAKANLPPIELSMITKQNIERYLVQQYAEGIISREELFSLGCTLKDIMQWLGVDASSPAEAQFQKLSQKAASSGMCEAVFAELCNGIPGGQKMYNQLKVVNMLEPGKLVNLPDGMSWDDEGLPENVISEKTLTACMQRYFGQPLPKSNTEAFNRFYQQAYVHPQYSQSACIQVLCELGGNLKVDKLQKLSSIYGRKRMARQVERGSFDQPAALNKALVHACDDGHISVKELLEFKLTMSDIVNNLDRTTISELVAGRQLTLKMLEGTGITKAYLAESGRRTELLQKHAPVGTFKQWEAARVLSDAFVKEKLLELCVANKLSPVELNIAGIPYGQILPRLGFDEKIVRCLKGEIPIGELETNVSRDKFAEALGMNPELSEDEKFVFLDAFLQSEKLFLKPLQRTLIPQNLSLMLNNAPLQVMKKYGVGDETLDQDVLIKTAKLLYAAEVLPEEAMHMMGFYDADLLGIKAAITLPVLLDELPGNIKVWVQFEILKQPALLQNIDQESSLGQMLDTGFNWTLDLQETTSAPATSVTTDQNLDTVADTSGKTKATSSDSTQDAYIEYIKNTFGMNHLTNDAFEAHIGMLYVTGILKKDDIEGLGFDHAAQQAFHEKYPLPVAWSALDEKVKQQLQNKQDLVTALMQVADNFAGDEQAVKLQPPPRKHKTRKKRETTVDSTAKTSDTSAKKKKSVENNSTSVLSTAASKTSETTPPPPLPPKVAAPPPPPPPPKMDVPPPPPPPPFLLGNGPKSDKTTEKRATSVPGSGKTSASTGVLTDKMLEDMKKNLRPPPQPLQKKGQSPVSSDMASILKRRTAVELSDTEPETYTSDSDAPSEPEQGKKKVLKTARQRSAGNKKSSGKKE